MFHVNKKSNYKFIFALDFAFWFTSVSSSIRICVPSMAVERSPAKSKGIPGHLTVGIWDLSNEKP